MNFRIAAFLGLVLALITSAARAENVSNDKATLPGPFGPPSWDTQYTGKQRFLVLDQFGDEAVLDRETGLVWQRAVPSGTLIWANAVTICLSQVTGHRRGWRLPSYEEMTTLLDPNHQNPALPANHPFTNFLPTDYFWTSTTPAGQSGVAFFVQIATAATFVVSNKTGFSFRYWCVRGGQGAQNPQ